MIDHNSYLKMLNPNATTPGRARKLQSDVIMKNTWWQDIQTQTAYFYDMYHDTGNDHFKLNYVHPIDNEDKIPIPIKFIRHEKQTYAKDNVTFWIQFMPDQDFEVVPYYNELYNSRYGSFFPVGLYVDIMDERGNYNKWLCVDVANYNQSQFPTFEVLRCDYLFQWIHKGKRCECPGVLRSQNSYNSGLWTD